MPGGSHYDGDARALGYETPWDFMYTDVMPKFFWRETFQLCREYIRHRWNASTFDEAFPKFAYGKYSQFNILSYCALKLEPHRYVSMSANS